MLDFRHSTKYWRKIIARLRFELTKYQRNLKRNIFLYISVVTMLTFFFIILKTCTDSSPVVKKKSKLEAIKSKVPQIGFKRKVPDAKIENLTMIGEVYRSGVRGDRMRGMILRSLRFQNITKAVEFKYNLPENLLLAMVMQESMGVDLLPNSSDDGGLGLCHMQPLTASDFGLKTLDGCTDLRNFEHGRKLRGLIRKHKFDKRKLIEYDDRFHQILNLDAAGRMLWYYKQGPRYRNTPIKTAIYRYAGYNNYKKYYERITYYQKLLNDKKVIDDVRKEFNRLNPNLKINDEKGDFDLYIKTHQEQHRNYGLDEYVAMK